jgi:hypothetical protein
MKITVNQLRRIIKEEVGRMMEMEITAEEPMDEGRGQKSENRREQLEAEIEQLEANLRTEKDRGERNRLKAEIDAKQDELTDLDFPENTKEPVRKVIPKPKPKR